MYMRQAAKTLTTSPPRSLFFSNVTATAQPIHVAITRRIKPGREQEFQIALKEFFARSLAESGVHGAAMLVPPPGSGSAEYGIIRSFATACERDALSASPLSLDWKKRLGTHRRRRARRR